MATQIVTDTAPTVYGLAYEFRNALLGNFDTREAAGALTFLYTAWAALQCRAARLAAAAPAPAPVPPAPAPLALPRRPRAAQLVASEGNPRLFYIVRDFGRSCTCPGFKFHGRCKHARRAAEQRRAQIAQLIVAARARQLAA